MVTVLMISEEMAPLGLLKRKIFQNKSYDVIVCAHDVTNKLLSRDSNYIADMVFLAKVW